VGEGDIDEGERKSASAGVGAAVAEAGGDGLDFDVGEESAVAEGGHVHLHGEAADDLLVPAPVLAGCNDVEGLTGAVVHELPLAQPGRHGSVGQHEVVQPALERRSCLHDGGPLLDI
ncbi:hypothetical protein GOP47_0031161, partial [Adiantum capillus-veneris]